MPVLILPYVLSVLLTIAVGIVVARAPGGRGLAFRLGGRVRAIVDRSVQRFTPVGASIVLGGIGTAIVTVAAYLIGLVTRKTGAFDLAVFRWTAEHINRVTGGVTPPASHTYRHWATLSQLMTDVGNKHQVWYVSIVAAVVLAFVYKQQFWVPPLCIAGAVIAQHYLQNWLAHAVDRGHPPTTLGTYPSGGVSRIIAIYGLIVFLILIRYKPPRTWAVALWTFVALLGVQESYSRWFLQKHWMTDIIGGALFGLGLLAANCIATLAIVSHRTGDGEQASVDEVTATV
jgi:membrane-associated phospholipid phosphatase